MGLYQLLLQEQDLLGLDLMGVLAGLRVFGPVRLHDILYRVHDSRSALQLAETGRVACMDAVIPAAMPAAELVISPVLVEGVLVAGLAVADILVPVLRVWAPVMVPGWLSQCLASSIRLAR